MFVWKLILDVVPVMDTLRSHHVNASAPCVLCGNINEDSDHLFLWCPFARALWFGILPTLIIDKSRFSNIECWLRVWCNRWKQRKSELDDTWSFIIFG